MVKLFAPAKVNLFLAIQGKDASGYHVLDTVFLRTPLLQDELILEPAQQLQIEFLPREEIDPQNNTILKTIHLLEAKTGRSFLYHITVHKNIPPGSGLGGGSSDAAVIMEFLNEEERLGYSREELMKLGAEVGADVPFFLSGYEVAHGTHYGERIEPLPTLPEDLRLRIALSKAPLWTKEAFAQWDEQQLQAKPPKTSEAFIAALQAQDSAAIVENLYNDFQLLYPTLQVETALDERAVLTGTGSTFAVVSLT